MVNGSRQWRFMDLTHAPPGPGPRPIGWTCLELVLPLGAAAALVVFHKPQYIPGIFVEGPTTALGWVAWGILGGLGGMMSLSALLLVFFLLYSPVYLVGKAPMLLGADAWTDHREVRFYAWCFVILCALVGLLLWDWGWFVSVFVLLAGFAPWLWRALV